MLFEHGKHPVIGRMPLGALEQLFEDVRGGFYVLRMSDTSYADDVLAVAADGQLGSSHSCSS